MKIETREGRCTVCPAQKQADGIWQVPTRLCVCVVNAYGDVEVQLCQEHLDELVNQLASLEVQ